MSIKRKKYSSQFKFDRAVETHKANNLSEISRKYGVSVNVLSNWRDRLLRHGVQAFKTTPDQKKNRPKDKIAKPEQMLGKKKVKLNLLKTFPCQAAKNSSVFPGRQFTKQFINNLSLTRSKKWFSISMD